MDNPPAEWHTLKDVEPPFQVYAFEREFGPIPVRNQNRTGAVPITITRLDKRGGVNYGYDAQDHLVIAHGFATKMWVVTDESQ